jgi:hypothetical protein
MKTETKTTITEITHDDLVNLFSTALYGSSYLSADYTIEDKKSADVSDDDCYEDIIAKILLSGKSVEVTDDYAEGYSYGSLLYRFQDKDDDDSSVIYRVTLDDIKRGLERAADGTFNAGDDEWTEQTKRSARVSFDSFMDEDACDFDLVRADILMQIILFDEIIYG